MRHAILVLGALAACAAPRFHPVVPAPAAGVSVDRIDLRWSNVYLLRKGGAAALVDSGSRGDCGALGDALAAAGVTSVRAVVLTHAHADHAGCARWLQQHGAAIVLGAADAPVAARGHNDVFTPTGLLAAWLAPMFMFGFDPFTPDLAVDHATDLAAYGLPSVRVVPMPGHTPGSLVVRVGDQAFAGDMMKGGRFAKLGTHTPSEHYYQADRAADHQAIATLLASGVTRFQLGHGGPVDAAAVRGWLDHASVRLGARSAAFDVDVRGERPRAGGSTGVTAGVRLRLGAGRPFGYLGGLDLRAGSSDGAVLEADLYAAGVALRARSGAFVAIAGGVGAARTHGVSAVYLPLELDAELPAGPLHLWARGRLAGGTGYAEASAMLGVRLGRDHRYVGAIAGAGPFLALTFRDLAGAQLFGVALGVDLWSGS